MKACKACREKFFGTYLPPRQISTKNIFMNAFNIPYNVFDPNQSIARCDLATTTAFSIDGTGTDSYSHTVTHDICLIHVNGSAPYGGSLVIYLDTSITVLKEMDLSTTDFSVFGVHITKSGPTITMIKSTGNASRNIRIIIYEFDFV